MCAAGILNDLVREEEVLGSLVVVASILGLVASLLRCRILEEEYDAIYRTLKVSASN